MAMDKFEALTRAKAQPLPCSKAALNDGQVDH